MHTLPALTLLVLAYTAYIRSCNEGLCAAIVSKCLLIKACECDMTNKTNCTCCRECHMCLAESYSDCCSCVGLCNKTRSSISPNVSTVDQLTDPIPELFNVLTAEQDPLARWTSYKYTPIIDSRFENNEHLQVANQDEELLRFMATLNCTVAYMSVCHSLSRCRDACESMGASKLRWFHEDGCCECIGQYCIDYGMKEPKCNRCPDEVSNGNEHIVHLNTDTSNIDDKPISKNAKTSVGLSGVMDEIKIADSAANV